MSTPVPKLRTLLILGRVSNLPTVWSNCLAAWLLNGGQAWTNFYVVCVGATLLYLGGMYLNDAFDADFDRRHRSDRPIPSGQITARAVWWIGGLLLGVGTLLLALLGTTTAVAAVLLAGVIVLYDAIHKRTVFAPLLMALCRFLLYLLAAAATTRSVGYPVFWYALSLAAYITGLSYFARNESQPGIVRRWPVLLLLAPLVANVFVLTHRDASAWLACGVFLVWLGWCLRGLFIQTKPNLGRVVAGLLAGIVLVDCAALPQLSIGVALIFMILLFLALLIQRVVPAT